jgi:plastocyanin
VIVSIALSFGMFTFTMNEISTMPIFAGVMIILTIPAIVTAYVYHKMPQYAKAVAAIFMLAAGAGIATFIGFGLVGPDPYLLEEEVIEEAIEELTSITPGTSVFPISILVGSAEQGNPDYEPDVARVSQGHVIEWTNEDSVSHTVTSSVDFGETFDSGLMDAGSTFTLDISDLALGEYEYLCIVHPWMIATIVIEEPKEAVKVEVSMPEGAGIEQPGQIYYDPEVIQVEVGTTVVWKNNDNAIHTVTSIDGEFDSDILSAGGSYEYTFNTPGKWDYFCIVHPWMTGSVDVE